MSEAAKMKNTLSLGSVHSLDQLCLKRLSRGEESRDLGVRKANVAQLGELIANSEGDISGKQRMPRYTNTDKKEFRPIIARSLRA